MKKAQCLPPRCTSDKTELAHSDVYSTLSHSYGKTARGTRCKGDDCGTRTSLKTSAHGLKGLPSLWRAGRRWNSDCLPDFPSLQHTATSQCYCYGRCGRNPQHKIPTSGGLRNWSPGMVVAATCNMCRPSPWAPRSRKSEGKNPGPDKSWYPPQDLPNTGRSSCHHYTLNRDTTRMQATHC